MKGKIVVLLSIALVLATVAQAAESLTYDIFLQKVMAYYPKLKAADSNVDIALARQMQAKAGFWPSVNVSAQYKVSDDPVNVFGMLLRQERFTSADFDLKRMNTPERHQGLTLGAYANWPLFDAMRTIHRARAARQRLEGAKSEKVFTQMEARLMAQDVYAHAVILDKALRTAVAVRSASQEDIKKAEDLKDRGMVLGADFYTARVTLGNIVMQVNELQRQRQAMDVLLNIMMGESIEKVWVLSETLPQGEMASVDPTVLMAIAYEARADLKALEAELEALRADLSRARSGALPQVNAFGDVTSDRDRISSASGVNYTAGLKAEVALFDRQRSGDVREQSARVQRLLQEIQLYKDMIAKDIVQELARQQALAENRNVVEQMAADSREAIDRMGPLYSEGRKSIADLLEVRRMYLQTMQELDRTIAGSWMSQGRMSFLIGQMDDKGAGL